MPEAGQFGSRVFAGAGPLGQIATICNTTQFIWGQQDTLRREGARWFVDCGERMYKNLNAAALGISGRQSELIELALTYGFRGLYLPLGELARRVRMSGMDRACRFLASAKIQVGGFDLPIRWLADRPAFESALVELRETAEVAAKLKATNCTAVVEPASDHLPYHENFELHRTRFADIAAVLGANGIKLGLSFRAAHRYREGREYPFIHQAETLLTLIKTIGSPHVGLALDTWDWYIGGGGMDQLRDLPCQQITSVRLADAPAAAELACINEDQRMLPGEGGMIDCAAIFRHLADIKYAGPVTLNTHPAQFAGMTRDAIVQKTSAVLDGLWRSAGLTPTGRADVVRAAAHV
ncbi:MAG: sugar phosphate isomerase/epimerase [Planctomycetes bacterium]|nr:sugar phosphate isomerase/epimerase [Planctomycetota bacterium]